MEIITIPFEESLIIQINGQVVKVIAFQTAEQGNIKLGIDAPRSVKVNREEVYRAMQKKLQLEEQE